MIDADREQIRKRLVIDEGLKLRPYRDTVGKLTIGIGRNLDDVGISALEAYDLLEHDIDRAVIACVSAYPWVDRLSPPRQAVLVMMMFNMGPRVLAGFTRTLGAMAAGDYAAASKGMLASRWATQVGARAKRLASQMLTGEWA